MLKLSHAHYAALRRHGEETYPHECCGVLLGQTNDDGSRVVTSTARCGNTRTDSPENRYHIDPRELIRIQREGRERGEDIVGFYHSHPDHPARPSQFDEEHAWPWYTYLVLGVQEGRAGALGAFELDESSRAFREVKLERRERAEWPVGKQDGKTSTDSFPS
jgi:proteasome lid subunit RPN8/RPN11